MTGLTSATALLEVYSHAAGTTDVPVSQVLTFLAVASHGEMPMADLEKATGVVQSSCSRNVARIGPGTNPKEPGLGLVETFEDPWYRRRKLVKLTHRGMK